jgi:hypothetical protein
VTAGGAQRGGVGERRVPVHALQPHGWSGTARESAASVGKRASPQSFWSHPRPTIHCPLGVARARATTRAITSSYERVP